MIGRKSLVIGLVLALVAAVGIGSQTGSLFAGGGGCQSDGKCAKDAGEKCDSCKEGKECEACAGGKCADHEKGGCKSGGCAKHEAHDAMNVPEGDKVKDPVCGMEVKKADAKTWDYEKKVVVDEKTKEEKTFKKTFHFCSDKCMEQFKKEPGKYVTDMPGETCTCKKDMPKCKCGHCAKKPEMCDCGSGHDEEKPDEKKPDDGHKGHDHGGHKH